MNEKIKKLAEQAKNDLVTEIHSKATGMDINIVKIIVLGSKLKDDYAQDFSTKFAELILEECVSAIKHESLKQLDPEFGIIYAKAIVARFGATLNQPFLRVEVKD